MLQAALRVSGALLGDRQGGVLSQVSSVRGGLAVARSSLSPRQQSSDAAYDAQRHFSKDASPSSADDPGSWELSPEFWGTQGGSWGRSAGRVVFEQQSALGQGVVSVTAHEASFQERWAWDRASGGAGGAPGAAEQEWRVLRFNGVTRQSVAKVHVVRYLDEGPPAIAQPDCLAFPYLKTMAAVILALTRIWKEQALQQQPQAQAAAASERELAAATLAAGVSGGGSGRREAAEGSEEEAEAGPRILCIGLGGGSLPLFLAHHIPGAKVDVCELDPVVVSAAASMGFDGAAQRLPGLRSRLRVFTTDGAAFVEEAAAAPPQSRRFYDLCVVDAFDGRDEIPSALTAKGGAFLAALSAVLHPERGAAVVNTHGGDPAPNPLQQLAAAVTGGRVAPRGYTEGTEAGAKVGAAARAFAAAAVLPRPLGGRGAAAGGSDDHHGDGRGGGEAFTLATPSQDNVIIVAARGLSLPAGDAVAAGDALARAGRAEAAAAGVRFEVETRLRRGFSRVGE